MEAFSYFFGIAAVVAVAFFLYEAQIATSQLSKDERSVIVIEKLESLKLEKKEPKVVASNIYAGLVNSTESNSSPVEWSSWFGFGVYLFGINILIFILLMASGNKERAQNNLSNF